MARQADDLGDLPEVEGEAVPGRDAVAGVALDEWAPDDPDGVARAGLDAVAALAPDLGGEVLDDEGRAAVGADGRGGGGQEGVGLADLEEGAPGEGDRLGAVGDDLPTAGAGGPGAGVDLEGDVALGHLDAPLGS